MSICDLSNNVIVKTKTYYAHDDFFSKLALVHSAVVVSNTKGFLETSSHLQLNWLGVCLQVASFVIPFISYSIAPFASFVAGKLMNIIIDYSSFTLSVSCCISTFREIFTSIGYACDGKTCKFSLPVFKKQD